MPNITKKNQKQVKLKPRYVLFLKNKANGMTTGDAYLAAGFKAKTLDSASHAGSRLLRRLNETMPSRDLLNVMVPDDELFAIIKEKLLTSPDDVQVRAGSLLGKWKGLEQPEQAGLQGSTIVIVQQLKDSDSPSIDLTPDNKKTIQPIKRYKLTD